MKPIFPEISSVSVVIHVSRGGDLKIKKKKQKLQSLGENSLLDTVLSIKQIYEIPTIV